jgi:hypothetical protein
MDLRITVAGAEEQRRRLAEYRKLLRGRIRTTLQTELTQAMTYGRAQLAGAGGPQRRTGRLQRSFRFRIRPLRDVVRARLGFLGRGVGYAWTQEYGADIRPKPPRKYLLIPLSAALTPTGRRSLRVRRAMEAGNTFVRGNIVYERRGKNTIVPLFVLKKFVHVPARPTLAPTWRRLQPRLIARLEDAMTNPPSVS